MGLLPFGVIGAIFIVVDAMPSVPFLDALGEYTAAEVADFGVEISLKASGVPIEKRKVMRLVWSVQAYVLYCLTISRLRGPCGCNPEDFILRSGVLEFENTSLR